MSLESRGGVTRRRALGLLGAGATVALAGCIGSGTTSNDGADADSEGSPAPGAADQDGGTPAPGAADQPGDPDGPGGSGTDAGADEGSSGTSLAGSCGAVFGDTDTRYDPGGNYVVTFAYPMGGEVINETRNTVTIGYPAGADGQYDQSVTVNQRGPSEGDADVGATRLANEPQFEDGGTVTYQGSERTVAAVRSDYSVVWVIGIDGPDGVYEVQVQASARMGDPCPDAYDTVCERVMSSLRPR